MDLRKKKPAGGKSDTWQLDGSQYWSKPEAWQMGGNPEFYVEKIRGDGRVRINEVRFFFFLQNVQMMSDLPWIWDHRANQKVGEVPGRPGNG